MRVAICCTSACSSVPVAAGTCRNTGAALSAGTYTPAGLDVSIQGEVLNLLSRLQRDMVLGILVITHNLNVVRHVADRMAIMYLGRIVEQGGAQEVFDQPRHPYTAALLSANPSPDPDRARQHIELQGEVPGLLHRPSGCEFHTRCPRARAECSDAFPPLARDGNARVYHCLFPMNHLDKPTAAA